MSYVIVENDQPYEISQIQIQPFSFNVTTNEPIEIPPDCVEYMGKLMCGEIVEATVINFDTRELEKTSKNILSFDGKPSPDHPDGVLKRQPDMMAEQSKPQTPTLQRSYSADKSSVVYPPSNNVFHHIHETHIHICECIAVFSCCGIPGETTLGVS
jgi:hypothetical protein